MAPTCRLITRDLLPVVAAEIAAAQVVGIDCETQDSARHEGLNTYCKYKPNGHRPSNAPMTFDMRRTVMTGFSVHVMGSDVAYYVNLAHADKENCISWDEAKVLVEGHECRWIAHNAQYEIAAFEACHDFRLENITCTLQMAVSLLSPDEIVPGDLIRADRTAVQRFRREVAGAMKGWTGGREGLTNELNTLLGSFVGKESSAAHSYNGIVKQTATGYGLKALVKRFFDVQMTTFQEVLGDRAHMGQLTGAQTLEYGADDAYWTVELFKLFLGKMVQKTGDRSLWETFEKQENPMVQVFADLKLKGVEIDVDAIEKYRDVERQTLASVLREMREAVVDLLPFPVEPHEGLEKADTRWYGDGKGQKYRDRISKWAFTDHCDDDFDEVSSVRGPVTNGWRAERGLPESQGPNFSHYMPIRTLMYDLLRQKVIVSKGKVQSDGEARGSMLSRDLCPSGRKVIECLNKIAGIEQRIKLYLNPYRQLIDPETGRIYPDTTSMLATRRMAASNMNYMQLGKRGDAAYIRGVILPDEDDHVIVSCDWSAFELVIIGELSGDPEFVKAYSQIPHKDLHGGAAASILGVEEEEFFGLRGADGWGTWPEKFRVSTKGEPLVLQKAYGYWRTELGKGANFNYWYSGFLSTVGDRMGWEMSQTGEATDRYRDRFPIAEEWRTRTIREAQTNGYTRLPDGHYRARYEATYQWLNEFMGAFSDDHTRPFWEEAARRIQRRAGNQCVNAQVQGTNAFVAKRSILKVITLLKGLRARFMMPVHDELVFSVHRDDVVPVIARIRQAMTQHDDVFKLCKLDVSASVGRTFEPWSLEKAPLGQIELDEVQYGCPWVPKEKWLSKLGEDDVRAVVDGMFV